MISCDLWVVTLTENVSLREQLISPLTWGIGVLTGSDLWLLNQAFSSAFSTWNAWNLFGFFINSSIFFKLFQKSLREFTGIFWHFLEFQLFSSFAWASALLLSNAVSTTSGSTWPALSFFVESWVAYWLAFVPVKNWRSLSVETLAWTWTPGRTPCCRRRQR